METEKSWIFFHPKKEPQKELRILRPWTISLNPEEIAITTWNVWTVSEQKIRSVKYVENKRTFFPSYVNFVKLVQKSSRVKPAQG